MKLEIDISPCPNDTFMFEAMVAGRVDTEGVEFVPRFADIEELNAGVMGARAQVSKISYAVLPRIAAQYAVLDSGSALGRGNGPLLVARGGEMRPHGDALCREGALHSTGAHGEGGQSGERGESRHDGMHLHGGLRVAVPGLHTTANLLMAKLFPQVVDKTPVLFSEIAGRVADGEFDAGVLIHEGRFTYAAAGLELVADLGREWERVTGLPLPLGAIVVSRDVSAELQRTVERVLRRSVEYAFAHPGDSAEFVRSHARELDPRVIESHIALFVNEHSVSLGAEGRRAVEELTGLGGEIYV